MNLICLPSFSDYDFRDAYATQHAAAIEVARAGTPEQREALQAAFRIAAEAERKRIDTERARIAAENIAAFLANPRAVMEWLDEKRGRSLYLGEMAMVYGMATVTMKRGKGRGDKVGKGTIGEGTISPFVVTVNIGDRQIVTQWSSRNDRHSKNDTAVSAVTRALLDIVEASPPA